MPILPLRCPIQHYPWGSPTSIPHLLGQKNPQNLPWAEMWMGAHPKASSEIAGERLIDYIRKRGDTPLPFLFKILAAERALSIQAHPSSAQAEQGFDSEEARGIPLDAPHRNYRDRNQKPEIIVALSPFWALKGFRSPASISTLFRQANIKSVSALLHQLEENGGLQAFFCGLLALSLPEQDEALGQLRAGLPHLPGIERRWITELLDLYPGDIGAFAALILQIVQLSPGQALYLEPGELHAYLRGTGLELMANSDNVLRGGLSSKHIDAAELVRILQFEHQKLVILDPTEIEGIRTYRTPCADFYLASIDLRHGESRTMEPLSEQILLSLYGTTHIEYGANSIILAPGQVAYCTRDTASYTVRGDACLWVAQSP